MRQTPFYRALIEPKLILGMDKLIFLMLILSGAGLFLAFKTLWLIVPLVIAFFGFRAMFKFDPLYLSIYIRYSNEADFYDPHVRAVAPFSGRKRGRGKGVLC